MLSPTIVIDIEAINPQQFFVIGIIVTRHPGNTLISQRKFYFPTHTWNGQTAEMYWNTEDNNEIRQEVNKLNQESQQVIKKHAGFTISSLQFWIAHLETLDRLTRERENQQLSEEDKKEALQFNDIEEQRQKVFRKVSEYLGWCIRMYPNAVYLSDNPAFDVGFLDCMLLQRGFKSIRESTCGGYLDCKHIYSLAEGILKKSYRSKIRMISALTKKYRLNPISRPTSHDPIDDCLYISSVYESIVLAKMNTLTTKETKEYYPKTPLIITVPSVPSLPSVPSIPSVPTMSTIPTVAIPIMSSVPLLTFPQGSPIAQPQTSYSDRIHFIYRGGCLYAH